MINVLHTLHTWARILAAAGGILGVLVAVPAFRLGGAWKTCLRIAAFVSDSGSVHALGGASHELRRPFARR